MNIVSRPHPFSRPPQPPQRPWLPVLLSAGAGATPGLLAGPDIGREIAPQLIQKALPQAFSLVRSGVLSPHQAFTALRWLSNPQTQGVLGAAALGATGAVLGGALAWSLLDA